MSDASPEARLKRLSFRAWRRGFREADLILGPFADLNGAAMSEAELSEFERLLEVPDQDLYGWLMGREEAPEEYRTPLFARLRAFAADAFAATPEHLRGS